MSELAAIAATNVPATVDSLRSDLLQLGLEPGDLVIVHSSLSALGWVLGGPQAVVEALLQTVGEEGTIVMPTHTGLSDPAEWSNPPVPEAWFETIRSEMPAYNCYTTPTRGMGQIVDCFRGVPGAIRSAHPQVSVAAVGPHAEEICHEHPLVPALGETSPMARLYELDAKILLLGVGHEHDTSMHLAEYRCEWESKAPVPQGTSVVVDGVPTWVAFEDLDSSDFARIGEAIAESHLETTGRVGAGIGRLSRQRTIVDYAAEWMEQNRPESLQSTESAAE